MSICINYNKFFHFYILFESLNQKRNADVETTYTGVSWFVHYLKLKARRAYSTSLQLRSNVGYNKLTRI